MPQRSTTASTHDFPTEEELSTEHRAAKLEGTANHADFKEMTALERERKEAQYAGANVFPTILRTQLLPASFTGVTNEAKGKV